MDNVQRQRENIVLYKDKKDGADYIRIEYAGNRDISQLLVRDADVEMADNGSAYIPAAIFRLSDFYDRYSPHAYIDYSRVYVRHPNPKGNTHCRKAILSYWSGNGTAHRP